MIDLELSYLNALASQLIFICAFLGGFSATLLGTLIISENESRGIRAMITCSAFSAVNFIVAVLAMTSVLLITTEGYPLEATPDMLVLRRTVGGITMMLGLISLLVLIGVSGWLKSKRLGWFTTLLSLLGLILILMCS